MQRWKAELFKAEECTNEEEDLVPEPSELIVIIKLDYICIMFYLFFTIDDGKKNIKKPHAAGETSPLVYGQVCCITVICKSRNM